MAEPGSFHLDFEPTVAHINFLSENNIERQDELFGVERFKGLPMVQKFSLAHHVLMAGFFAEELSVMGHDVDPGRALWKGEYHDEPERVTGDVPTPEKRAMSSEEREKFEAWELEIMQDFEPKLDKPTWADSATQLYVDHRRKETVEDRIVNFFDKWDASNEAVHEIVCGDGGDEFSEILGRYKEIIAELRGQNLDWLEPIEKLFGEEVFTVPDPGTLTKKTLEDMSYASAKSFIEEIAKGNPFSYTFWLAFNSYLSGLGFLLMTFPGWEEKMPPKVLRAIELVKGGKNEYISPSGLVIPGREEEAAMKFARSLSIRSISSLFDIFDRRIDNQA